MYGRIGIATKVKLQDALGDLRKSSNPMSNANEWYAGLNPTMGYKEERGENVLSKENGTVVLSQM